MDKVEVRYPGRYPVFFIGASAGGVSALKYLAQSLPEDFPAPVFFLLHRRRTGDKSRNLLPDVLRTVSQMPVCQPEEGEVINAGHIYVPHNDLHIAVEDNRIVLPAYPDDEEWRPGIDVLFKSGARGYRDRAVSVLLTGDLHDGVEGLRETTYHGGITIAQSPDDAYNPVLPLNAVMENHPNYVLSLADMPALFCELVRHEFSPEQRKITEEAAQAAARERAHQ